MKFGDYELLFENGGIRVCKADEVLYQNAAPLTLWIKAATTAAQSCRGAYETVQERADAVIARGSVCTMGGSAFTFSDEYRVGPQGFEINRGVTVTAAGDDLGFADSFSLRLMASDEPGDYRYFSPGYWYDRNQFARDGAMGKDMDCDYYWFHETHLPLPLFAAYRPETGEALCFSRLRSDVTLRSTGVAFSENSVDEKMTVASLGMHRCRPETVNYTYYGYGVRALWDQGEGLMMDYLYPGSEGETAKPMHYGGLDFKQKAMDMRRTYHPVRQGFSHSYALVVTPFKEGEEDLRGVMRRTWRDAYARLQDPLFNVVNDAFYHDSMEILNRFTRPYGESWGLPFAAQLPDMDVNSVSFQFGFVGQQPGIGYQLLRQGLLEGDRERAGKGMSVLKFWVRAADTDSVLPPSCYNPIMKDFEPYPYYLRMAADGLEAIQNAYLLLKKREAAGESTADFDESESALWLRFLTKYADSLCRIQCADGHFCRAYTADGTVRMDSGSNTPSVIRFLIEMYRVTGNEDYKNAAVKAGEWSYRNAYLNLEYRGGTCDNLDIQDKEAGIYALWGFIALYELTEENRWLEAAKGAADYTETWTYIWSFPIHVPFPVHPFQKYSISGQSVITVQGGADVYMAVCPHTYLKMYFLTGDEHYLHFARFLNKNTRQATDVDGSVGYCMRALGHESGGFNEQTLRSNYHWLPWCTFVAVDSLSRMKDEYGAYEVEDIIAARSK